MISTHQPVAEAASLTTDGPPAPLLTISFFLAGLGTVYLGPVLPALLQEWTLTDQRGGLLLLAKFAGAFLGGVTVPPRLRLGILAGHLLAALGFAGFAFAHSLTAALPLLLLTGFGLGQIIASTNILAGRRWPAHTGSALALINLFWSLGAVSTGLLAAALLPRYGWRSPTLILATLLFLVGLAGLFLRTAARPFNSEVTPSRSLPRATLVRSGALLLLYGGLETCLTAWLTTYTLRFAGRTLLGGQSGFVILWISLTAGRGLASLLLRRWSERQVGRASLVACFLLILLLTGTHTALSLSVVCILLGIALAPVFPSMYGSFLRSQPPARVAGAVLAVSGLGAALFPWLMGIVSTHSGSLRLAMLVPAALVLLMLAFDRPDPSRPLATPA